MKVWSMVRALRLTGLTPVTIPPAGQLSDPWCPGSLGDEDEVGPVDSVVPPDPSSLCPPSSRCGHASAPRPQLLDSTQQVLSSWCLSWEVVRRSCGCGKGRVWSALGTALEGRGLQTLPAKDPIVLPAAWPPRPGLCPALAGASSCLVWRVKNWHCVC